MSTSSETTETVKVPVGELVDIAVPLLAIGEFFAIFNGTETPISDRVENAANALLLRAVPDGVEISTFPLIVEVYARAKEHLVEMLRPSLDCGHLLDDAVEIRESGCAFGYDWLRREATVVS